MEKGGWVGGANAQLLILVKLQGRIWKLNEVCAEVSSQDMDAGRQVSLCNAGNHEKQQDAQQIREIFRRIVSLLYLR